MHYDKQLTDAQREQLRQQRRDAEDGRANRRRVRIEHSQRLRLVEQRRSHGAVLMIGLICLVLVAVFVGIFFLIDDETPHDRLAETTDCQEVLDIIGGAYRDAGLATLGRIRYEELGCNG